MPLNNRDEELEKGIRKILDKTSPTFQFAAAHGLIWDGGDLVPGIMQLVKSREETLIREAVLEELTELKKVANRDWNWEAERLLIERIAEITNRQEVSDIDDIQIPESTGGD